MRQAWILGGLLLALTGVWLWRGAGAQPPPTPGDPSVGQSEPAPVLDRDPAPSSTQGDATGAERPIPNLPVEGQADDVATAPLAPAGDPFGSKMFEVIVLDRRGQPIAGATVESIRGNATTDRSGRAWLLPLGYDLGSPSQDRRWKTLTVHAPGYETLRHWVESALMRSTATVRLLEAVSAGDDGR